jgi:3-dehydroquinate synthase
VSSVAGRLEPAVWAEIGERRHPIYLGSGLVDRIGPLWAERAAGPGVLVVHDEAVAALAERAAASLAAAGLRPLPAAVPSGERSKRLAQVERLSRAAARAGLRRADAVLAVGGGVVGDLAGFVAASYQRGVRLVHAPTTLLAMVDSSVGGKTGVDLPEGKNYVGAIWQPEMIVMDTDALDTLPGRELSAGFAEVVKYGLLAGGDLWDEVQAWPALPGPDERLAALILRCVRQKLAVVAADERDLGGRAVLNLGHTVGHGIEAAGAYAGYLHGEAIALGLLAALRLSAELAGLETAWRPRVGAVLERHGLPTRLDAAVRTEDVLAALSRDKKADAAALNMVLLSAPGAPVLGADPPLALLAEAVEELRR